MFGHFKRSYTIEKAYDLWRREAGVDLKTEVSKFPVARQAEFRDMLRDTQKDMNANLHEVAVMMMVPFVHYLDASTRKSVTDLVTHWTFQGQVRATVETQFKQVLLGSM